MAKILDFGTLENGNAVICRNILFVINTINTREKQI